MKRKPSDFVVDELLDDAIRAAVLDTPPAGTGHALYQLRKSGVTTPQAIAEIARRLRVPPGSIGYGGLKDRHAETSQHVTVPLSAGLRGAGPRNLDHRGWRMERLGWLDAPLNASAIAGNRFTIVVRGLNDRAAKRMDRAARLLAPAPGSLRIVNYFGDQRFGGADSRRELLAPHLMRGNFEKALRLAIASPHRKDQRAVKEFRRAVSKAWGRWSAVLPDLPRCPERRVVEHLARHPDDFRGAFARLPSFTQTMAVEAYQSLLWNMTATRLVVDSCASRGEVIVADDPWGDLAFPAASIVPTDLATLELPLLAPGTELLDPWRSAAEAALAEEDIHLDDLRIPGLDRPFFGAARRSLLVDATAFEMSATEPDETDPRDGRLQRGLRFTLPRGAYATVLLRALGQ
ncbi:MAG: tRNA pseudouridine(13) synthase TruD [Phycisphaerales bacterium]